MALKETLAQVGGVFTLLLPTTIIPLAWAIGLHRPALFAGAWLMLGSWLLLFDVRLTWSPIWARGGSGLHLARTAKVEERAA